MKRRILDWAAKEMPLGVLSLALLLVPCSVVFGDILFIGANSDESEHFAFVALSNYSTGTVLNFTDSSYGSNGVGESDKFRWTEHFNVTPTGGPLALSFSTSLSLGQVVIYDDVDNRFERPDGSTFGTVAGAELDLSTGVRTFLHSKG